MKSGDITHWMFINKFSSITREYCKKIHCFESVPETTGARHLYKLLQTRQKDVSEILFFYTFLFPDSWLLDSNMQEQHKHNKMATSPDMKNKVEIVGMLELCMMKTSDLFFGIYGAKVLE